MYQFFFTYELDNDLKLRTFGIFFTILVRHITGKNMFRPSYIKYIRIDH